MSTIVITGMPGAGKTTVGKAIAALYNLKHVSAGAVARHLAKHDEETKTALARGLLAPKEKMNREMIKVLKRPDRQAIDGYPRYFEQLADILMFSPNTLFIHLDVDINVAFDRLKERARSDDHNDAIVERFSTYYEQTGPVVAWLATRLNNSRFEIVNSSPPLRVVIDSVGDILDRWFGVSYSAPGQNNEW